MLSRIGDGRGYIFNLGHGVMKETPVEHALALVEAVHAYRLPHGQS